jgi:GDSL-like Lipase/Acylhydrolase family
MHSSFSLAASIASIPRRKSSNLEVAFFCAVGAIALLACSELACRFVIGLGDPPLYQADAKMEYVLQPSKTYSRFHNRFSVNRYSMRAEDFPPQKSSPNELRVIVIGDSIVYGGVRIDQSEIDTEILKRNLQSEFHRPVVVGNASAKSWGPPNELAYLERFGTLDADVVILELSSHDYADAPTFVPVVGIAAEYPEKRPVFALQDLFGTYLLPRYFHVGGTPAGIDKTMINSAQSEQDIVQCREAERQFFRFVRRHNARVALVQHLSLEELNGAYQQGYYANQAVAKEENVPYVDDADGLRNQLRSSISPFFPGDSLHLDRAGQSILAATMQRVVDITIRPQ